MDNNEANQWFKDNLFGHEPNPNQLFIDRKVPGTYNRILAFEENFDKESAINETKNELRNRLPKMNELIDQLADTKRTRDDLRVQYGYDFNAMTIEQLDRLTNLNDEMEKIHNEAKWISSNKYKNMLKMKIKMLRDKF